MRGSGLAEVAVNSISGPGLGPGFVPHFRGVFDAPLSVAETKQRSAVRMLRPIFVISRVFGLAPFRMCEPKPPAAQATVNPCPWSAAYSVLVFFGILASTVTMSVRLYRVDRVDVLSATFVLKQVVSAITTACTVFKGVAVALAIEQLVSSHASVASSFSVRRAGWVVALQAGFLVASEAAVALAAARMGLTCALSEVFAYPILYLVNAQFTNLATLLNAYLTGLNESLAGHLQEGGAVLPAAWPDGVAWMAKHSKGTRIDIHAARVLQRDLQRAFRTLDDAFGVQNLLFVMVTFVQITVVIYVVFVEDKGVLVNLTCAGVHLLQLCAMLTACQHAKEESLRTAPAVHRALLRADLAADTRLELTDFSVQLLSAEMNYSAWGFFSLDYGLLQSFVATVVTYLVILVQFRGKDAPQRRGGGNDTDSLANATSDTPPNTTTTSPTTTTPP